MEKRIKNLESQVQQLYTMLYSQRARSVEKIIGNKVVDTETLINEFECLLDCIEDKRYYNQFWKLVNYVERFDRDLAACTVQDSPSHVNAISTTDCKVSHTIYQIDLCRKNIFDCLQDRGLLALGFVI